MNDSLEILKYPIGRFKVPRKITSAFIETAINEIEMLPQQIQAAVAGLSESQLNTPYREGGWNLRQVVHHLADSHINSYVRFKWALTEDMPIIKAYDENTWANLADYEAPVEVSLALLTAMHQRWVILLKSLSPEQLKLKFIHPESKSKIPLNVNIVLYAWHGKHHLAHIERLKERMGW
ncbi:MAG: YfiT family bacillithiol transferase [Chitinophagales bacterium]